jgi:putative acetyltransferase
VNELAFGKPQEADLVARLRGSCPGLVSLVAVSADQIVGHILFSPAVIEGEGRSLNGMGLAPVAVLPAFQRQGIGKALIGAGIDRMRASGEPFVIVLGHPGYYPTFGFVPASRFGIRCEYDGVPNEAFMILVLKDVALAGISGVARYRPEFAEVT